MDTTGWLVSPLTTMSLQLELNIKLHITSGILMVYTLSGGAPQHLLLAVENTSTNVR